MNELVSVIVPVYNVSEYLDRCIVSILKQTYTDLEILLIDDGSTDNSLSIIRKWEVEDDRIKVITKSNGGLSDARNFGIKIAKGSFIIFVDSDDVLNIHIIEHLINLCKNHCTSMSICGYSKFSIDSEISIMDTDSQGEKNIDIYDFEKYFKAYISNSKVKMVTAWAKLYKKELFDNILYPVGKLREDEFTTYKLVDLSKRVAVSNAHYYYYFQRKGSIMSTVNVSKYADYIEALYERYTLLCCNYPDLIREFGEWFLQELYVPYLECLILKYDKLQMIKTIYNNIYKKHHCKLKKGKLKQMAIYRFPFVVSELYYLKRKIIN